ncbi:hypothetical protein [Psychrobacter sp. P11G5]|uniref:hypothetical protein n=1 Tax=Psychrobacter sp. P11G5 TaxID=1699624 RepID=UPI00078B480D|nr:hypothetical protein [Psychrobacter sp. P11G5]AMN66386.1 hypothetical protein AK825_00450 [Psychrobacter sp. P11G5]
MTTLQLTHAPILNSSAQILILPVNNAGIFLDPVLMRTKTLYPDNYQRYYRTCRDGSLEAGSCLLHKRLREHAGLGISSNGNQPSYVANLVISDHPYHPARSRWLTAALTDLCEQLIPLIRYQGVRRAALFTRPLVFDNPKSNIANTSSLIPLDWHTDTLPLLNQYLQDLPKVRVDIHLPKSIAI